jgi:hypothetical protein
MWYLTLSVAYAQELGQLRVLVVDHEDELPIRGVPLQLSGEPLIGGVQDKVTDADGVVLFSEIPAGLYRLVSYSPDFGGVTIENIQIVGGRATQQRVELRACEIV